LKKLTSLSRLPAHLHIEVARDCVVVKKRLRLLTLVMLCRLDEAVKENNLIFMNGGLDQVDHMSAMKIIDE
jgi:hypothetical protein